MWVYVKHTFVFCKFLDINFMGITSSPLMLSFLSHLCHSHLYPISYLTHLIFNLSYVCLILPLSPLLCVIFTFFLIFVSCLSLLIFVTSRLNLISSLPHRFLCHPFLISLVSFYPISSHHLISCYRRLIFSH